MGEIDLCSKILIEASDNPCDYVQLFCTEQWEYLNFIGLYYCQLNQSFPLVILVALLVVLFVFNFLGTTADTYLGPSLEVITQRLKLSEAIAGVTLLALANGATDVIAGLVAGGKESGGLSIAIGGLFGACLFTVTMVLARCIQGDPNGIHVDAPGLKRDIFFLLLATVYFIFLTILNQITWVLSLGFFVIYIAFISYVIYVEKQKSKALREEQRARDEEARIREEETKKKEAAQNRWAMVKEKLLNNEDDETKARRKRIQDMWDQVLTPYRLKSVVHKRRNKGLKTGLSRSLTVDQLYASEVRPEELVNKIDEEAMKEEEEDEDNSLYGKIMRIYNVPLLFVRNLTMPPFEEDKWNVYFAAASPIFGFLFFVWQFGLIEYFNDHKYFWAIVGVVTVSLAILGFIKGRNENLAIPHGGKLATVTFLVSALWLNLIATCFMDLLSLITVISGLPLNYLSMTLLAWGNSLDDFFIDYVIAKSGHGRMAVTGVYGGQLFNLLIGFGGSMLLQSRKGVIVPSIYEFGDSVKTENILTILLLACLIVGLLLTLVVGKVKQWVLGKGMMTFLVIFYTGFLVAVTLITFCLK